MSTHSLLSPSGHDRWRNCPASIKAVQEMKALGLDDTSEYAAEGTQAHEYCEKVLKGEMELADVPDDFRPGVELYVNSIQADLEFGGELIAIEEKITWHKDSRVGGTPDCVHRIGNCLVITDFKYGAGEYVPADSMQLKIYGTLAYKKYGSETDTQIELRIVQPRYERDDVEKIRSTFWGTNELVGSVTQMLLDAIDNIEADPDRCVAGDHCRWCPKSRLAGMPPCPAHLEKYTQLLQAAPLAARPENTDKLEKLSETDQLKLILDSEEIILKLIAYAKKAAHERIYKGEKIEGYSLQEAYTNRKWASSDSETIARELRKRGLKYGDIWVEKIISPAQAEKLTAKGMLDDLITRDSKGLVLQRDKKITKQIKSMVKKLLAENPLKGK